MLLEYTKHIKSELENLTYIQEQARQEEMRKKIRVEKEKKKFTNGSNRNNRPT